MNVARTQRGFSLLEVLVAFSIMAITLGVIMQIFSGGARNAAVADDYATALQLAESQLAAAGVSESLSGTTQGEFAETFRWEVRAEPYGEERSAGAAGNVELYRVVATVRWEDGGRTRSLELATLKLASR